MEAVWDGVRKTVDEKLQTTLEKRLGESFKLVGDLMRVLPNVKARGTWAEAQLGALLDDILAPGQFEKNVHVEAGDAEMVEFAVRLPGPRTSPAVACGGLSTPSPRRRTTSASRMTPSRRRRLPTPRRTTRERSPCPKGAGCPRGRRTFRSRAERVHYRQALRLRSRRERRKAGNLGSIRRLATGPHLQAIPPAAGLWRTRRLLQPVWGSRYLVGARSGGRP